MASRSRHGALGATLFVATLFACAEAPSLEGPRVLAGGEELLLVDPAAARTLARVPLGSRISEILPAGPDEVWVATWAGLTHLPAPLADPPGPATTDSLGILDGIELAESGLLYLLQHPGLDPTEVTSDHLVLEWDPSERRAIRSWSLDRLSYDLHLDPGRGILVTPLSGRRLWWVSFSRDEAWPIDLPPAPGRPDRERSPENIDGGASYVRIGAALPGGGVVVVEQGLPERNRVWLLDPEAGTIDGFDLDRSSQYQGGSLAPDGHTLVLNAIDAVQVVDLDLRAETAWIPLDAPHYRVAIGREGRLAYLTTPGRTLDAGRITTIDLEGRRELRRSTLPAPADAIAIR